MRPQRTLFSRHSTLQSPVVFQTLLANLLYDMWVYVSNYNHLYQETREYKSVDLLVSDYYLNADKECESQKESGTTACVIEYVLTGNRHCWA